MTQYEALANPSVSTESQWFRLGDQMLFQKVIDKYMLPNSTEHGYDDKAMNTSAHQEAR